MGGKVQLPKNATQEMRDAARDIQRFEALGNYFGKKQAEAHLKKLLRKARIEKRA